MVEPVGSAAPRGRGPANATTPSPSLAEVAAGRAILRFGHADAAGGSDAVATVQRQLAALLTGATTLELAAFGLRMPFAVNGVFADQTDAAVRWFQDRYRDPQVARTAADGRVGQNTLELLQAATAAGGDVDRFRSGMDAGRGADAARGISPRRGQRSRALVPPGTRPPETSRGIGLQGSVGRGGDNHPEDVARVRRALQRHGYLPAGDPSVPSGWDPVTDAALQRFQTRNTVHRDVRVDPVARHGDRAATELALGRSRGRPDIPHADVARHPDDRLLDIVSRNEGNYTSVRLDLNTAAGVSFGFIQFNQSAGSLGDVLRRMHDKDPGHFAQVFGRDAEELLRVTGARTSAARLQPVGGLDLWDETWLARFRQAGAHPPFIEAQREVARASYLEPALRRAELNGFHSERAKVMILDIAVQHGLARLDRALAEVAGLGLDPRQDERAALEALGNATKTGRFRRLIAARRDRVLKATTLSDDRKGHGEA